MEKLKVKVIYVDWVETKVMYSQKLWFDGITNLIKIKK
jgi:hypothetical protein